MNKHLAVALISLLASMVPAMHHASNRGNGGCCTVICQVNDHRFVVAYRRDATTPAVIHIREIQFAGRKALQEYKNNSGGWFCHTIITKDGWVMTIGGRDNPTINRELTDLASKIVESGKITKDDLKKAESLIRSNGWGHFVIKSPDSTVGVAVWDYRVGSGRVNMFKLQPGWYVKVTNNPGYYAHSKWTSISKDPVKAAVYIIGADTYGIHRRDVIVYDVNVSGGSAKIDVSAAFDGGAMVGGAPGSPDPIDFMGKWVPAKSLPTIPKLKYLGTVDLTKPKPAPEHAGSSEHYSSEWPVLLPLAMVALLTLRRRA